jgi:8-oxo-dGTP pyrophosphatase MutT (NUDIX family)
VRDRELLVFDHRDFSEAGTQVPAGTDDNGEDPPASVVREVFEETGVRARVVRELGTVDTVAPRGKPRRNHFFELATNESRDSWDHVVHGHGEDRGLVFLCRFTPLDSLDLIADGEFLAAL